MLSQVYFLNNKDVMKITIAQIKFVHTLIFWILSLCVLYSLLSGICGYITSWTWIAVGLVAIESVILIVLCLGGLVH
jgi:hypothetical protein